MQQRIFVIDDEADLGQLLKGYLEKKGFVVEVFGLLHEGLEAMEENPPDILFLDNNLPDGLGWKRLMEIRENFPGMYLHLLSGFYYSKIPLSKDARVKVWQKPFTTAELDSFFDKH